MAKNILKCPNCNEDLVRTKRTDFERLISKITFNNFLNRKYFCYACLKEFSLNKKKSDSSEIKKNEFTEDPQSKWITNYLLPGMISLVVAAIITLLSVGYFSNESSNFHFSLFRP